MRDSDEVKDFPLPSRPMLRLDQEVVHLFRQLLAIPGGTHLFCNTVDGQGKLIEPFAQHSIACACASEIPPKENPFLHKMRYMAHYSYNTAGRAEVIVTPHLNMVRPIDQFHYGFALPPWTEDSKPVLVEDQLRDWKASKLAGKEFVAPLHLMLLEALWNAVLPGGYFGAVLPRHWIGSAMRYMKWWNENVALVAKIVLPSTVVMQDKLCVEPRDFEEYKSREHQVSFNPLEVNDLPEHCQGMHGTRPFLSSGNLVLFIWHKTVDPEEISRTHAMFFASRRWTAFIGKLKNLESKEIDKCLKSFGRSDWFRYSVRPWLKFIEDDNRKYRKGDSIPHTLHAPDELRIIHAEEESRPRYEVKATLNEIAADPLAVHIKPGPPVKLYTYIPQAQGALQEIQYASGLHVERGRQRNKEDEKDEAPLDNFTKELKARSFTEQKENLLKILCDQGLHPYLLAQDHQRVIKEARWLDIQLSPIERTVQVPSGEPGISHWETLYDDMSIPRVYPEIWDTWVARAKEMKLDKFNTTYDFQFNDIIWMACKSSVLNGNVMGLGKTREVALAGLLLGCEKVLIVSPTRLIGVWQDEIETTIANYVRRVRLNWMGKPMNADINIIQWAKDCRPENMRMFNIISYEKLPRVPNDALFFECPACKFVICSLKGIEQHACPKCNEGREQHRLAMNAKLNAKKYKDEQGRTIDDRVSSRKLVMMIPCDKQQRKISKKAFNREVMDPITGQPTIITEFKEFHRKPHLKWTFSHLLRNRFTFIGVDEANYIKNAKAQRSTAMNKLTARRRVSATGTPVRGYPKSIVNILNWTFKRSVFPEYRSNGKNETGARRFENKYAYYVDRKGSPPKLIPRINNPELFQAEIAPLLLRHLRNEPEVAKAVPPRMPEVETILIPMDPQHRIYYKRWLEVFAEWWQLKRMEEDRQAATKVNDLLVKLGYLMRASSMPHFMLDKLTKGKDPQGKLWASLIGPYTGPVTAKFELCTKLVDRIVNEEEEKVMVFCWYVANLELGRVWCQAQKPPIAALKIDGSVSTEIKIGKHNNRSERQMRVDRFRYKDYMVLWAATKCMAEGYNIPEANHAIFHDYTWEPADWEQAIARMLRPAQKRPVYGTFLVHEGTADEYVSALVQLKARSVREGVDYEAFDDFKASMVPDFIAYANAIVEGKDKELTSRMRDQVEELKKQWSEE
jgi:SNF2 family DNA or RNA helicase